MDFKNVLLTLVIIGNIIIGSKVYFCDPKKRLNQAYLLFIFGIIGWTLSLIFFRFASTAGGALTWARLLYLAPVGIVVSFVFFCSLSTFSSYGLNIKEKLFWLIPSIAMLLIILWPGVLLQRIIIPSIGEKIFIFGWGYILYFIYIPSFFIWGYWLLYKRFYLYCKDRNLIVRQFRLLFAGIIIASMGGMFTNLFLVTLGISDYNWAGPLFTFFMLVFIAYGMKKYFLMNSLASSCVRLIE